MKKDKSSTELGAEDNQSSKRDLNKFSSQKAKRPKTASKDAL
jgi:hypothetical protein